MTFKTLFSSKSKTIIIIAGIFFAFVLFLTTMYSSISTKNNEDLLFAVPTGSTIQTVLDKLDTEANVSNTFTIKLLSQFTSLRNKIPAGLYKIPKSMSALRFVLLLRSGKRETVTFTIKFERTSKDIAELTSKKLEANYEELISLLNNKAYLDSIGFTPETVISMFIPDSYDFKWNTTARDFLERMHEEYVKYWTEERRAKAAAIGFTPVQISTIASIVNQESNKVDEKPRIAGVYINRLHQNMPLQADPTVKFAVGDFSIKRIRKGHLKVDSPYNTYKNTGLPPGPICTPQKRDIDAVMNYEKHSYIFFCAKPDFSGYHRFAKSYEQHLQFADEYQTWLNSINIQ